MRRTVMNLRRAGVLLAASLVLGGCVSYRLSAADVLPTDRRLQSEGVVLSGKPVVQAEVSPEYTVTAETLRAEFGEVALTRVEGDPARPVIVFCGGNLERQNVRGAMRWREIAPFGDLWLFDYPGYGKTDGEGAPAEFDALNAALARRIDEAYRTGGRTGDLVFWGFSLGGGVCAKLAATVQTPSDVVLVGTFRDYESVVEARAGAFSWLVRPVIASDVPNTDIVDTLADHEGAIIVVASLDDRTVPYRASRDLERSLRDAGRTTKLVTLPSAVHTDIQSARSFGPGLRAAFDELGVGAR